MPKLGISEIPHVQMLVSLLNQGILDGNQWMFKDLSKESGEEGPQGRKEGEMVRRAERGGGICSNNDAYRPQKQEY